MLLQVILHFHFSITSVTFRFHSEHKDTKWWAQSENNFNLYSKFNITNITFCN